MIDIENENEEIEDSEEELVEETVTDGVADATGQGQNAVQIPAKGDNPFEKFYVVELQVSGISAGVNTRKDHLMATFYRLNREQINKFAYLKVKFYRECKKLSTFRLNGKYVMPLNNISALEHEFRDVEGDFMAERNAAFKELRDHWDEIVATTLKEHPDLGFTEEELESLRPVNADNEFMAINYEFRSLNQYLQETKGLKDLLEKFGGSPDVAKRVEVQRDLIVAQIRAQYEDKLLKLEKQVEGLKEHVKKKGKKYEKTLLKANAEKNTLLEMADILGEKDVAAARLESMLEVLAENRGSNNP